MNPMENAGSLMRGADGRLYRVTPNGARPIGSPAIAVGASHGFAPADSGVAADSISTRSYIDVEDHGSARSYIDAGDQVSVRSYIAADDHGMTRSNVTDR